MKINKFSILLNFLMIVFVLSGCLTGGDEYNKGVEYQHSEKIDLAEQQYKIAIQKNPQLAEAHMNIGQIYLDRGWYDGAEASTKKAIEIFERTRRTYIEGSSWEQSPSLAYNNLGAIEIRRGLEAESKSANVEAKRHWEKAMSFFNKAVELDTSNSAAQANLQRFRDAY